MSVTLAQAISTFGAAVKGKLANPSASGQPEDQLRAPFEVLLQDLAELASLGRGSVDAVGEASVSDIKSRPDYAVTVNKALVGHIELKAPGKGADPRKFKDQHDREQWQRLKALPNLIYSDGNEFSLWQDGRLCDSVVRLDGDVELSGNQLKAPSKLVTVFERFLSWNPQTPRSAKDLAHISARLCRLLRDEVTEQLDRGSLPLTSLAADWRKLLFPDASNERFADGYAQAVTFGLLMARARDIELATSFHEIAEDLGSTSTLMGAALDLLTQDRANRDSLKTALGTLIRVLDAVDWRVISKGDPEAWLYFYEEFLSVYDNRLRKLTGSYYTPPEVVSAMVRLVDEELRGPRFNRFGGIASRTVTLADPAMGTGTFLLGLLRHIAASVAADQGDGAVPGAINDAIRRVIAFELQLGPFAVAQLRILAEIVTLSGSAPDSQLRLFVTDTLGSPEDEGGWIPGILAPIASSRKEANKIKRDEPITVVIGNPPYKEKAKGMGGWVEGQGAEGERSAPLAAWQPPAAWGLGAHAKHLRNLYVYFWRWATWKVFDHGPGNKQGIVCFITVAGFLNGPGFERMRDYLRRTCDEIWVIDCSPEGHQPDIPTRIFEGVQQPICIVLASRGTAANPDTPARVHFRKLPVGRREKKFEALAKVTLSDTGWTDVPTDWRSAFLPVAQTQWSTYPALEEFFVYHGSGVQPKRTWVVSPDTQSLRERWGTLVRAPLSQKEELFHATLRNGEPADRHIRSRLTFGIPGFATPSSTIAEEQGPCPEPVRYNFRSFDRQWIIPDIRVITQPNAELWASRSNEQVYLTALTRTSPTAGPALTLASNIPDLDHYNGRGGRVSPLWRDAAASESNVRTVLLDILSQRYGLSVTAVDVFAYIVAVAGHSGFTTRFAGDLSSPGIRIPMTADPITFRRGAELGRRAIWLQTFGERMADPASGRPLGPPRLPPERRPVVPSDGQIPSSPDQMPDNIYHDTALNRLHVGAGFVENVTPEVWQYQVSGKQVLRQWFSYRRRDRDRPLIGDRRRPSPLGAIQPNHWLPEYTEELINVLNVLALLVELEPTQSKLLDEVCDGPTITMDELRRAGVYDSIPSPRRRSSRKATGPTLFDDVPDA